MVENSYSYSIPYVLIFLFIFILSVIDIRNVNRGKVDWKIRWICFLTLLIFFGLRGFIATDWASYYPLFEELPTLWDLSGFSFEDYYMEPGFIAYSILVKSIWNQYHFWVFINTFIDLLILHYLFKRDVRYYIFSFLIFYLFLFLIEINLYRNIKSILLFVVSLMYLSKKRYDIYLLINIVGCMFHVSSVLYILLIPILNIRISKLFIWIIFILGNLIYLYRISWSISLIDSISLSFDFLERSSVLIRYAEKSDSSILSIGYIERISTFILFAIYANSIRYKNRYKNIMFNIYILYFISFFYFSQFKILSDRFSSLFQISYLFIYPWLLERIFKNRLLFIIILFIYGMMKQINGHKNIMSKYTNLIFGIESYEKRLSDFNNYYKE